MRRFVLFLLLTTSFHTSGAEPVYKHVDAEGRVIFQAGKNASGARADLPPIQRERLSAKIESTVRMTPETCLSRGGVDCSRGRDPKDGSAFCLDGFGDVALQFHEACGAARLELTSERFLSRAGEELTLEQRRPKDYGGITPEQIIVHVRNLTGVRARGVEASGEIVKRRLQGSGPEEIEPFGLEEYVITIQESELPPFADFRRKYKTLISCQNCEAVKRSQQ